MPSANYNYTTYIACLLALILFVFNIYYFFIWRDVGISFYIKKVLYPTKDAVLMSPEYKDQVDQYAYLNQAVGAVESVLLGDSNTKGFNVQEYFPGYSVLNRGMYSDTTVSLLERLDKNVNNLKIRKLFLLIGYNDLQYRSNAEIVANMSMILDRISAEKVFLQSILPVEAKSKDTNLRINDLNEDLKRLCTAKGVAYLDLNRHFLDEAGGLSAKYSIDGRHLSGSGYRLWKELIKENL